MQAAGGERHVSVKPDAAPTDLRIVGLRAPIRVEVRTGGA
jgi:hypothetical protein